MTDRTGGEKQPPPVDLTQLEAAKFVIVGEWLAEAVTGCTCGTGGTGYGHEAGCGLEPVAKIADLLAAEVARPQLLAASRAVERVRALHYNDGGTCRICVDDDFGNPEPWPCPTVAALDGAE